MCSSYHPLSKAITGMLLCGELTLQSQGNKGLTSDGSSVAPVKGTWIFTPFNVSDFFLFSKGAFAS